MNTSTATAPAVFTRRATLFTSSNGEARAFVYALMTVYSVNEVRITEARVEVTFTVDQTVGFGSIRDECIRAAEAAGLSGAYVSAGRVS